MSQPVLSLQTEADMLRFSSLSSPVRFPTPVSLQKLAARKLASLGGAANDSDFEKSFSTLAHVYLRDKAPSLLKYEVGFQLIDKNEDNTKAAGMAVFRAGGQWLYVPILFISGRIKGHELLYLKDLDQFVPLKDNWVQEILNKRPSVLGEPIEGAPGEHGISAPDFQSLRAPRTKFASHIVPTHLPAAAVIAHCLAGNPLALEKYASLRSLPQFLESAPLAERLIFARLVYDYPAVAQKIFALHKEANLDQTVRNTVSEARRLNLKKKKKVRPNPELQKALESQLQNVASSTEGGVLEPYEPELAKQSAAIVIYSIRSSLTLPANLSDKDKEELLRKGYKVEDRRSEAQKSKAYTLATDLRLANPTQTGIYDVFLADGTFERCLVIPNPFTVVSPNAALREEHLRESEDTTRDARDRAVVIRLSDKRFFSCPRSMVYVRVRDSVLDEDSSYESFYESLPTVWEKLSDNPQAFGVILTPRGSGTQPIEFNGDLGESSESTLVLRGREYNNHTSISVTAYPRRTTARFYVRKGSASAPRIVSKPRSERHYDFHFEPEGSYIDVFLPGQAKFLSLSESDEAGCCCSVLASPSEPPFSVALLGKPALLDLALGAALPQIKVAAVDRGRSYIVNGKPCEDKVAALSELMLVHGLSEQAAEGILKEASAKGTSRFWIKYAQPTPPPGTPANLLPGPGAPPMPDPSMMAMPLAGGGSVNTMPSMAATVPAGLPQQTPANPYELPADPMASQALAQAAQTGQKEVLDPAAIGAILRYSTNDNLVDQYIPELMAALDRLGRILLAFYWHREQFQERYGKQDLPELEDSLRTNFERLGDLVLSLKQRTIEPLPGEVNRIDLEPQTE